MRLKLSIIGILIFASSLHAGSITLKVTPATLGGWTVTGATHDALAALPALTIPAGAQLAQLFQSPNLAIHLTTQPVLGTSSADWPVLEIGSAALLFSRDASGGKLVLAQGDSAPIELPIAFALDAQGRSKDPLTLGFSRHDSTITVQAGGQTLQFPAAGDLSLSAEVVISAGKSETWTFDSMEIAVEPSASPAVPDSPANAGGATSNSSASIKATTSPTLNQRWAPTAPASQDVLGTSLSTPKSATGSSSSGSLEVFTPSSMRHGRAETVRANAAQAPSK